MANPENQPSLWKKLEGWRQDFEKAAGPGIHVEGPISIISAIRGILTLVLRRMGYGVPTGESSVKQPDNIVDSTLVNPSDQTPQR